MQTSHLNIVEMTEGRQEGALILVVGPSGAGKDSLIDEARKRMVNDTRFHFPTRIVTRAELPSAETHHTMTDQDFEAARSAGHFALSWNAHGNSYGILAADVASLNQGRSVIINVSRTVVSKAEQIAKSVSVINVTAPRDVLAKRIAARGREPAEAIEQRLAREPTFVVEQARFVEICNDRELVWATDSFLAAIHSAHVSATSRL